MRFRFQVLLTLLLSLPIVAQNQQDMRLLRFPTIHGNSIVFTYAGDLYKVDAAGGVARRLTSHIGDELFARFSPDGTKIAFAAQYDGNTEVYVMPAEGGTPARLTYTATLGRDDVSDRMGPNNIVMGWKDNNTVLYRSRWREFNDWKGQLYTVSVNGGFSEQLPLPRGGFASYSPDGSKLAYNRIFREFRTWKRYRGGQADEVWIYDFATKKTEQITDSPAQDIIPMWVGDKVYFTSDRTNTLNLFYYDLKTKQTVQVTNSTDFDVKFPSGSQNGVVYEFGGYIYKHDATSGVTAKVPITINEDFSVGRGGRIDVSKAVTNFEIAPDGSRALLGARGEIFTVPVKSGVTRNLTNTSGVHERGSVWSPDGRWIAYISDATGEDEIYVVAQDGTGEPVQLTKGADTYKFGITWSPDSKKIMWNDKKLRLQFVDVESKNVTTVVTAEMWEITSTNWSPDSKWIAYAYPEKEKMGTVYLYSLESKEAKPVTDGWFDSYSPAFSDDGKFLFFVSDATFNPNYSATEWNHSYDDMAKIYMIPLAKSTESPFKPTSDEVKIATEEKKPEAKKDDEKKEPAKGVTVTVDFDGIIERTLEVTATPARYFGITSAGNKIYYLRRGSADTQTKLFVYDFDKKEETELGDLNGYEISTDNKKMLISAQGSYSIIDLPSARYTLKDKLNLSDLIMNLDRKAEWKQIFSESWRQMKYFFYDPNMHGVDWDAIHKKYEPLVEYVNHRKDLSYIIGEMIGELNVGHAYVNGGDFQSAPRVQLGLLGAELSMDKSGFVKVDKVLDGRNWDKSLRSPLTEIGAQVKVGEFIVEIDGVPTNKLPNIYAQLVGKVNKQVILKVNSKPSLEGARTITVLPIADEQPLYYHKWVMNNVQKVNEASKGAVGYIHVPDMGVPGLNQFVKYFYPQLSKKGLIIDIRGNGGGNVSPMLIERLQRKLAMVDMPRNVAPRTDPSEMHLGPKVALLDEFSASDGDLFPYRFKHYNMGPLIGKRSWGGVVGIRGSLPFVDGGTMTRPEFASYDVKGKEWIIEGHGVDPDIYVDNDPALEFQGVDQQLTKGIEVILDMIEKEKPGLAPPPPYPVKKK